MGERAEPMQRALARHRQNSGEQQQQQLPDPETDDLSDYLPLVVCTCRASSTDGVTRLLFRSRFLVLV